MLQFSHVQITPRPIVADPVTSFDLDVSRSPELLLREQRAFVCGHFNPLALRDAVGSEVHFLLEDYPIKLPGSPVYMPDWMMQTGIPQQVVDHRFATSRAYDDQLWVLYYERHYRQLGDPARQDVWGCHIDEYEEALLARQGRISTAYLGVSSIPTHMYDGLGVSFNLSSLVHLSHLQSDDEAEYDEIQELADKLYSPHVYPPEGRCYPAGSLLCMSGVTPHKVGTACEAGWRAMCSFYMRDVHRSVPDSLIRRNPALHVWAQKFA